MKIVVADNFFQKKQPMDLQGNFLRHKRNEVALNSFLVGKLLTIDFGGAIVFISVNNEIKYNSTDVNKEGITSSFFGISKSTWWNVWCQNGSITETFIKLSSTLDKVDKNELNLIEKYVCAASNPHNHICTSDTSRL